MSTWIYMFYGSGFHFLRQYFGWNWNEFESKRCCVISKQNSSSCLEMNAGTILRNRFVCAICLISKYKELQWLS